MASRFVTTGKQCQLSNLFYPTFIIYSNDKNAFKIKLNYFYIVIDFTYFLSLIEINSRYEFKHAQTYAC